MQVVLPKLLSPSGEKHIFATANQLRGFSLSGLPNIEGF